MSVVDLAAATPQGRTAKLAAVGVIGLIAVGLVLLGWYWFFVRPSAAETKAAESHVEAAVAQGTAGLATGTLALTLGVKDQHARSDALTEENRRAIMAAEGAGDSIGADLDRAGRAALCLRSAYQRDAGCAALPGHGGGVGPAQADTGGGSPGE